MMRAGLLLSAVGWGISFYFTFVPWDDAAALLMQMGAEPIAYQPLLDYWLKMASVTFGCVGLASLLACLWPERCVRFIGGLVPFHIVVGATLIVSARVNQLDRTRHPAFGADITFCFLTAFLIGVPLWRSGRKEGTA